MYTQLDKVQPLQRYRNRKMKNINRFRLVVLELPFKRLIKCITLEDKTPTSNNDTYTMNGQKKQT